MPGGVHHVELDLLLLHAPDDVLQLILRKLSRQVREEDDALGPEPLLAPGTEPDWSDFYIATCPTSTATRSTTFTVSTTCVTPTVYRKLNDCRGNKNILKSTLNGAAYCMAVTRWLIVTTRASRTGQH